MVTRRQWFSIAGSSAVAVSAYAGWLEPNCLEVTYSRVALRRHLKEPVRILQLADFHASSFVPISLIEKSIRLGLEQNPDLICLTGDFITFKNDFDNARLTGLLRRLSRSTPTYAVLGNHDGGRWAPSHGGFPDHRCVEQILNDAEIHLLHNRAEIVWVRQNVLTLVGVGDLWSEEIDASSAFEGRDGQGTTILLSHNPDSKELLASYPWDLMLSGHTHGGQVLIPFCGPRYAPVVDKRFVAGLRTWRGRQIYVTRGVGSLGGVRVRCRPEITLLTLT